MMDDSQGPAPQYTPDMPESISRARSSTICSYSHIYALDLFINPLRREDRAFICVVRVTVIFLWLMCSCEIGGQRNLGFADRNCIG